MRHLVPFTAVLIAAGCAPPATDDGDRDPPIDEGTGRALPGFRTSRRDSRAGRR